MKKFTDPIIEISTFEIEDVITTSNGGELGDNDMPLT